LKTRAMDTTSIISNPRHPPVSSDNSKRFKHRAHRSRKWRVRGRSRAVAARRRPFQGGTIRRAAKAKAGPLATRRGNASARCTAALVRPTAHIGSGEARPQLERNFFGDAFSTPTVLRLMNGY
jgi:hypothetical protein